LNFIDKLDEQLLTSSEPTVVEVWEDDVKNIAGAKTPHYNLDRLFLRHINVFFVFIIMDELVEALRKNGYSRNASMTLSSVIANTMQDGQYSPGAYENARILAKYEKEHGDRTMKELLS
jgi:hypothetical protein